MSEIKFPTHILALAEQVNMTPIKYHEYPDRIVIIFEQGPKMTFDRADITPPTPKPLPTARKPRSKRI